MEPLGPSWDEIGVVLGLLLGHLYVLLFFGAALGARRVPKGKHFGSQTENIDTKLSCKLKSEKKYLGGVLDRFGLDFQAVLKSNMCVFIFVQRFCEHRNF